VLAVQPEVIRVDRSEKRIVRSSVEAARYLQQAVADLDIGRRQLEMVARHVAIGAGPSIPSESGDVPVDEREKTACDGVARFAAAPVDLLTRRLSVPVGRNWTAAVLGRNGHSRNQREPCDCR
jgi:hypothetical protein